MGSSSYDGPVTVTLIGLPSGISVTPVVLAPGVTGTLQLTASVAADQEAFSAAGPDAPDTATSTVTVLAFSGSHQATAPLALTVSLENPAFAPLPSQINLPVVAINTGGTPVVDTTTNVPGTITITSADGQTSFLPGTAGTDNTATFQVHGNSTSLMPKKPYHLKLNTSADLLSSMGLTCPYVTSAGKPVCDKSKSYVLLANYDDKTMLRDWSASALANAIPIGGKYLGQTAKSPTPSGNSTLMSWAPHSLFVELYLNGQYEGTYELIEEVKVDSHRINITEMANTITSGNGLTGGYLMEIDQRQAEDFAFVTPHGVYAGLEDPDFSPEVPEQTTYISNYVDAAEAALYGSTYTDPAQGWRAYFDEASAVNFYIVNDLFGNWDGGRFFSSDYMYKDKNNPLIYMGPVWDFDVSSGNAYGTPITDPAVPWMAVQAPWYAQLFSDPSFKSDTAAQWNALRDNGVFSSWLASIAQQAASLGQAEKNNFGRWPMQGIRVWPNVVSPGTYDSEVNYFIDWLTLRMGYMDGFLNGRPATKTSITVVPNVVRRGTPITLNAQVTGDAPTGTVTFSYDSIVLGQSSLNGSGAASLTTSNLPVGDWYVEAFYDGDTHNAISGALGPMVYVLPPLLGSTTNLTADITSAPYSSSITLTGVVVGNSGGGIPGGSMSFSSNEVVLGSTVIDGTGKATLSTSSLPPGSNLVHVTYSGDATYASSVSNVVPVVINQESANLVLGNLNASYDGNAHAVTATFVPAGLSISLTYNGSAAAPTTSGSYAVVATVNDPDYTGSAAGILVIGPGAANITLGGLNTSYDGTAHTALVATTPQGLSYAVTYSGSATPPTMAGTYAVVATVKDPNYTGSATGTLNIAKATVPVVLGMLSASYDGNPHAVTATTLPALLKVELTYNGSSTVPIAAGTYTVLGTVDDGDYSGSATGTLVISTSSVAITWSAPEPSPMEPHSQRLS
ncbi:MAG: MBG domain-containing protein [Janthinobacterium lividum]